MARKLRITINDINITNPLTPKIIKALKESFVEVYGEPYREHIERAIDSTNFYFLPTMKFEEGDLTKVSTTINDVLHRQFANPHIMKKIKNVTAADIEANLDEIYNANGQTHKDIFNEHQKYKLDAIIEGCIGKENIDNPKFRNVASLFENFISPYYGMHSFLKMPNCLLNDFFAFQDREALKEYLSLMGIEFNYNNWPTNGDAESAISAEDLDNLKLLMKKLFKEKADITSANPISCNKQTIKDTVEAINERLKNNIQIADPFIEAALNDISEHLIVDKPMLLPDQLANVAYNGQAVAIMIPALNKDTEQLSNIIICPDSTHLTPDTLIHEINHSIDTAHLGTSPGHSFGKIYEFKTGYQYSEPETALNEIINELISQMVTEKFNTRQAQNPKLRVGFANNHNCAYTVGLQFFNNFVKDNWDFILKSRMSSSNTNMLKDMMGEDNYKALCDIATLILKEPHKFQPIKQIEPFDVMTAKTLGLENGLYYDYSENGISKQMSIVEYLKLACQVTIEPENDKKDNSLSVIGAMTYLNVELQKRLQAAQINTQTQPQHNPGPYLDEEEFGI